MIHAREAADWPIDAGDSSGYGTFSHIPLSLPRRVKRRFQKIHAFYAYFAPDSSALTEDLLL
jgi:hypothetical protein